MKYFQLNDSDGESMGILKTDLDSETIKTEWNEFYLSSNDCGVDTFAEFLSEKYGDKLFTADRFFIDEEINP